MRRLHVEYFSRSSVVVSMLIVKQLGGRGARKVSGRGMDSLSISDSA